MRDTAKMQNGENRATGWASGHLGGDARHRSMPDRRPDRDRRGTPPIALGARKLVSPMRGHVGTEVVVDDREPEEIVLHALRAGRVRLSVSDGTTLDD